MARAALWSRLNRRRANTVSAVFSSEPNTINPALNSAVDAAIYMQHAFEGLYKYADAGRKPRPVLTTLSPSRPRTGRESPGEDHQR